MFGIPRRFLKAISMLEGLSGWSVLERCLEKPLNLPQSSWWDTEGIRKELEFWATQI